MRRWSVISRGGVLLAVLLCAFALVSSALTASAADTPGAGDRSPELVPFVGTFRITATWGKPSDYYHGYPAIDVSMKVGTDVYAAGTGTIATLRRDTSHCDPCDRVAGRGMGSRFELLSGSGLRIPARRCSTTQELTGIALPSTPPITTCLSFQLRLITPGMRSASSSWGLMGGS